MIKVFISSTYVDLVDHRRAVIDNLHRMKDDVKAMEYFGANPDTPEKVCAKEIRDCDVLIGIYAFRYGWQPEPGGRSITEQEYDLAVEAGKDCLCYVMSDDQPTLPRHIDAGKARIMLNKFKAKVGRRVVSTFTTPDDLAKKVAADLHRLIQEKGPGDALNQLTRTVESLPLEVRSQLQNILSQLPETPGNIDTARFVARPEFFGSMVYDRHNSDYIPFDQEATDVFRLLATKSREKVYEYLKSKVKLEAFEAFLRLCQTIDLVDQNSRFTGVFLDAMTPPHGRLSAPVRVFFSCTNACNFRCSHCYASSGNPCTGELTTPQVLAFIDDLAAMGCYQLSLGGGEPLVRSDLCEIIRKANRRGIGIRIATNAAAATKEIVNMLSEVKIHSFKVSMEGASEDIYDTVRGEKGAFTAALQGIKNLKTLDVPIELHRVFMKQNTGDLKQLVALANELGVSKLTLGTVLPVGRAAANSELVLTEEELIQLWSDADDIQKQTGLPIEIPQRPTIQPPFWKGLNVGCRCGNSECHVDPHGNVTPTGMAGPAHRAGNIQQDSLREIWNSGEAFIPFREPCSSWRCLIRDGLINRSDNSAAPSTAPSRQC